MFSPSLDPVMTAWRSMTRMCEPGAFVASAPSSDAKDIASTAAPAQIVKLFMVSVSPFQKVGEQCHSPPVRHKCLALACPNNPANLKNKVVIPAILRSCEATKEDRGDDRFFV